MKDTTFTIRLSQELKDAFFAACGRQGVVPSKQIRYVIKQLLDQEEAIQNETN